MKYFKIEEFACKCGCGINNMSKVTLDRIDKARALAGIPFIVNSACRCPKRNKSEGGADDSAHLTTEEEECEAVDIKVTGSRERYIVVFALLSAGFNRIGIAKGFVHGDTDLTKDKQVIWTY